MKLLLDENFPCGLIKDLKKGNDVEHVLKKCKGKTDQEILAYALKNKRTILTLDSDFCGFKKREHYGIIKLSGKIKNPDIVLLELLKNIKDTEIKNVYFQIDDNKVFREDKVYSRKRHLFKHFRRTTIFLECMNTS